MTDPRDVRMNLYLKGASRAHVQWNGKIYYVANLPGDGGVDWGYSHKASDAIYLSPWWRGRLVADCRRSNNIVTFIDPVKN